MEPIITRIRPDHKFNSYREWQALYKDPVSHELFPNIELWVGNQLAVKINSLGCRGPEIDPEKPTILFLGDSTTFCVSAPVRPWPEQVKVAKLQTLNAAVEGIAMDSLLKRYDRFVNQKKINVAAVVVYTGWHNIVYGTIGETYWESILKQTVGNHTLAVCTLPTCLTEECRIRGVDALISANGEEINPLVSSDYNSDHFNFWGDTKPTLDSIDGILNGIQRYNQFVRDFCTQTNSLPINLHAYFEPESYPHIPDMFFDILHFRPVAYPQIARIISRSLETHMENASKPEDMRKNIYSIF